MSRTNKYPAPSSHIHRATYISKLLKQTWKVNSRFHNTIQLSAAQRFYFHLYSQEIQSIQWYPTKRKKENNVDIASSVALIQGSCPIPPFSFLVYASSDASVLLLGLVQILQLGVRGSTVRFRFVSKAICQSRTGMGARIYGAHATACGPVI